MSSDLTYTSIRKLHDFYQKRQLSPVEFVQHMLDRLNRLDGKLRSHITICADEALAAARQAEQNYFKGRAIGPLHGIPISHKDNIWTAGIRTTVHSRTSLNRIPVHDATVVSRLNKAGALLLGKTNTTEFACGDMHIYGHTPNPWNLKMYTGASSAGSASAVSAGLTVAATGSDTGGSIRAPASMCGIVGVKPTYGRVSRHGLIPLSWSMDNIGPMTRTVTDAAIMLENMAGRDEHDATTSSLPVETYSKVLSESLEGMRVGVPDQHFNTNLEPDIEAAMAAALKQFQELGAELIGVDLPSAGDLTHVGNLLVKWEAFTLHATLLQREAQLYGPKARRNIAAGAFFSAGDVGLALQLRKQWCIEVAAAFQKVDVIVTPTLPKTACSWEVWISEPPDTSWGTRQFNLSGNPAMTQPCGFDRRGLPIGLQIVARHFEEVTMFRAAHAYEQAAGWHLRHPPVLEVP